MKMWRCGVCGYIHEGSEPPDTCPKCGAPREKFAEIAPETVQLIERSRLTNQLHMDLSSQLELVTEIARKGIEDKLDPTCVTLFEKALAGAQSIQQMIKAELAAHISKGKWG